MECEVHQHMTKEQYEKKYLGLIQDLIFFFDGHSFTCHV